MKSLLIIIQSLAALAILVILTPFVAWQDATTQAEENIDC
jgi:hypothetical protein